MYIVIWSGCNICALVVYRVISRGHLTLRIKSSRDDTWHAFLQRAQKKKIFKSSRFISSQLLTGTKRRERYVCVRAREREKNYRLWLTRCHAISFSALWRFKRFRYLSRLQRVRLHNGRSQSDRGINRTIDKWRYINSVRVGVFNPSTRECFKTYSCFFSSISEWYKVTVSVVSHFGLIYFIKHI